MWFQQRWWFCLYSFLNFGSAFYGPPGNYFIDDSTGGKYEDPDSQLFSLEYALESG